MDIVDRTSYIILFDQTNMKDMLFFLYLEKISCYFCKLRASYVCCVKYSRFPYGSIP